MSVETCRRCGTPIPTGDSHKLISGQASGIFGPSGWVGVRCVRCSWPHVRDTPSKMAIRDPLRRALDVPDLELPDSADLPTITATLTHFRDALVARIGGLVNSEPYRALAFLIEAVRHAPRDTGIIQDDYVLTVQVIYAALLRWGPMPVFAADDRPGNDVFAQLLTEAAAALVNISKPLRDLDPGICQEARLSGGTLFVTATESAVRAREVVLHGVETLPRKELPRGSERVDEVERLTYGTAITEMHRALMYPEDGLAQRMTIWVRDDLRMFDVDAPDGFVQGLREYCVLNPVRWRDRAVPSFFFADTRPATRSDDELIISAAEVDWLRYAPLMAGAYDDDGRNRVVGFTSPALILRAFQRSQSALAGRLRLAEQAAATRSAALGKDVRAQARLAHAEFEADTASVTSSLGLSAMQGVERLNNKPLPPGEIDVLAHGVVAAGCVAGSSAVPVMGCSC